MLGAMIRSLNDRVINSLGETVVSEDIFGKAHMD